MMRTSRKLHLRKAAWTYGRNLRNQLVLAYREEYGVEDPPAPALIVDELITDFMGAQLVFQILPPDQYAQTEWLGDRPVVTVNTLTAKMPGVKNPEGVQNVSKFHEVVHLDRDLSLLRVGNQGVLPGFEAPASIKCFRSQAANPEWQMEFWAEEAGRAAAVSFAALQKSEAFRALLSHRWSNAEAWRHLGQAARDIGVNISALVTQLSLEGIISVEKEEGRNILHVQQSLLELSEDG